jgi:hypothetical protein
MFQTPQKHSYNVDRWLKAKTYALNKPLQAKNFKERRAAKSLTLRNTHEINLVQESLIRTGHRAN